MNCGLTELSPFKRADDPQLGFSSLLQWTCLYEPELLVQGGARISSEMLEIRLLENDARSELSHGQMEVFRMSQPDFKAMNQSDLRAYFLDSPSVILVVGDGSAPHPGNFITSSNPPMRLVD
jgi:hypothetical protein